jgi:hypothetical protein
MILFICWGKKGRGQGGEGVTRFAGQRAPVFSRIEVDFTFKAASPYL